MRLKINDTWVVLPTSLREITLKQRIDFQREHGDLLDQMLNSINQIQDEDEREIELLEFSFEKMFRTISFYSGFSVESLKQSMFVNELTDIYVATLSSLFSDETFIEENPQYEFMWNDEKWFLYTPELKNSSKMTFGEFIDAKQIVQDMVKLGKNRWECLLPLCCIYLRKEDEMYKEEFVYDDSERHKLMESVPLDIALHVGFFLSSSLNSFTKIFPFSSLQESKITEKI